MNIYRHLAKIFKFGSRDLFFNKDLIDNSLSYYCEDRNYLEKKKWSDKFFLEIHRVFKGIVLLINMFDRKFARLQARIIKRQEYQNKLLAKNKNFHNKYQGRRCFVVGNGSSLAKQNLLPLADEITIATNTIWKHPEITKWRPTYYTTAHMERFYDQEKMPAGFEAASINDMLDYFSNIKAKMPDSTYFLPLYGLAANRKFNLLPEEQVCYLPFLPYPIFEFIPNWPDLTQGLPGVQDASQYAIMIAMAMGFKQIILLGCDHDWFVNLGEEKHFFAEPAFKSSQEKYNSTKQPLAGNFLFSYMLWRGHENLKQLAESRGVEIINATGGGVLDVYPLASYEALINNKNL